ncbi:MAG TPA: hypothetical protein VIU12_22075 [Chryseolinea sp.]
MLKKTIFFIIALCALVQGHTAYAQKIRINLYGAYVFDDKFDSYYSNNSYYEGKIKGGLQWGGGIEYMVRPEYGVELLYLRQSTHAPTTYSAGIATLQTDFDLGLNYILLGGGRHALSSSGKLEGFGGLMAGMVIADLKDPDSGRSASATKFAWGLRLGGIAWASDAVGIKLQAQLLSAVQSAGGGFYFGTGGAGAGVSTYSTIYQFSLGGGLVFKVGAKE